MDTAIRLREITKRFGDVTAVDAVSLEVPAGCIYGFIGPNGSGKTTTLRRIMRLLLPDHGRVEVLGDDGTAAARDRVGYLPEERGLYKKMTVRRLLRYYGRLKGRRAAEVDRSIGEWLKAMGLADWADRRIDALSKGMAQKVQFMAAVVAEPDLAILDEPFTGLDPVNADVLKDAMLDLKRRGTTVVLSTHDMNVAERMCDRIFMIFRGRKVLDGTLAEIQAAYGADTIRVRTEAGRQALAGLPGIESVNDYGNMQEVRIQGDPQRLLQQLSSRTSVTYFEVTRPSLQDIFVRIARPGPEHASPPTGGRA